MEDSTIPPRAPTPPFDSRCYWSSSEEEEEDDDEPPAYRQDYLLSDADLPPYALPDRMPHTSRRARFSKPKPKKAVLDAGDGWSRVEYGYRTDSQGGTLRSNIMMPPVDKELSVQKMKEEHEKILGRWRGSEHRNAMVRELEKRRPSEGKEGESKGWGVSKAVCIALGSLSMEWHVRIRSVWQFAFFMDVVDLRELQQKYIKQAWLVLTCHPCSSAQGQERGSHEDLRTGAEVFKFGHRILQEHGHNSP